MSLEITALDVHYSFRRFLQQTIFNKISLQAKLGSAKGGPYLGVHLRRKDFIWGHREDVPSLKGAVKKIRSLMKKHKLDKVFVATDADGGGEDTNAPN